ncbi:MAG: hypothetical protein GX800_07730 [Clostridiaceae bacterium]|nr:hypothetical protein [Clostridiaceae bacterium]
MKNGLKNYTRSAGARGTAKTKNYNSANAGGSAKTPTDWDFAIQYLIFNKIGGGFYFYGCANPDMGFWDYTPTRYDLQVFYYSDGEMGSFTKGDYTYENAPILKSGRSYILNVSSASLGTLGDAISNSFTLGSYEHIYIRFHVYNTNGWGWFVYNDHYSNDVYSTPYGISYSNGQVSFNCDTSSWVTACEFYKSTTPYPYSTYSDTARSLLYEAACQNTEWNYEHKFYNKKFKRWNKTTITIGVNFMSSVTSASLRSSFKGYVQQSANIINDTVSGSGFYLNVVDGITGGNYYSAVNRTGVGDIQLWWGNYRELWDEDVPNDYRYFGTWETNADDSSLTYITEGTVRLCTEKVWLMNYQGITFEEIVETLGAGNDVRYTAASVFSDYWYPNKNLNSSKVLSPYTNDLYCLEMMYNYDLPSNIDNWEFAKLINAPNGHRSVNTRYSSSGTIDLSFLDSGTTYYIRLVSADYDDTSQYSNWQNITTSSREPFKWTFPKNKGQSFNLTASEWLALQNYINQVRVSKGLSAISFTIPYTNNKFLASMYNECGNAIKDISGYGSYIPTVSGGGLITGYNTPGDVGNINNIVSELNAIP